MIKKIGFIGVGAMGSGMVKNLLKNNYKIKSYDISENALKKSKLLGATRTHTLSRVAENVDAVIMSLTTPEVIENVVVGKNGILNNLNKGSYILDMSTTDPILTRNLAKICKEKSIDYLDSPVSGGPKGADDGTLTIMVGGAKKAFEETIELYKAMGENVFYIGESGSAQVVKLCHNMLVGVITLALGEVFLTGKKFGVKKEIIADVIKKSVGRNGVLEIFGPIILKNDYKNPKFKLIHMHKDLLLYTKMVNSLNNFSPMGNLTFSFYTSAVNSINKEFDHSAVVKIFEKLNNLKL